jgi:hypothetical protein
MSSFQIFAATRFPHSNHNQVPAVNQVKRGEQIRFVTRAAQLDILRPRLEMWLSHVFRVMGGYVVATGVLTVTLAATSFRAHHRGAAIGALIGGAASIGWMAAVNFMIDSDFKRVLLGIALVWACSLGLFWLETRTYRRRA